MSEASSPANRARRWIDKLNDSRHPLWIITVLSFLETILIPVPIELVLVPLMAANRKRVWVLASMTLAGCIAAAVLGYGVGMVLYESLGRWFIDTMGYQGAYESFKAIFDRQGFVAILLVGIIPIPFQIAMITAGLAGYPFYLFLVGALLARGVRYYGLAWAVWAFGPRARRIWKNHAVLASVCAVAVIAVLYVAGQYVADQII